MPTLQGNEAGGEQIQAQGWVVFSTEPPAHTSTTIEPPRPVLMIRQLGWLTQYTAGNALWLLSEAASCSYLQQALASTARLAGFSVKQQNCGLENCSHDSTPQQLSLETMFRKPKDWVGGEQTAGVTSTGGWKWGFLHFDPQPCGNTFTAKRPLPTIAKTLSCPRSSPEAAQDRAPMGA